MRCDCVMCDMDYTNNFLRGIMDKYDQNNLVYASRPMNECYVPVFITIQMMERYRKLCAELANLYMEQHMREVTGDDITREKHELMTKSLSKICAFLPELKINSGFNLDLLCPLREISRLFMIYPAECKINVILTDMIAAADRILEIYLDFGVLVQICI